MAKQIKKTNTPELVALAARIRSLRNKQNKSHENFAFEHGINRVSMWRAESGYDLRFSSLVLILNALEITLPEFFSEGFDTIPPLEDKSE